MANNEPVTDGHTGMTDEPTDGPLTDEPLTDLRGCDLSEKECVMEACRITSTITSTSFGNTILLNSNMPASWKLFMPRMLPQVLVAVLSPSVHIALECM